MTSILSNDAKCDFLSPGFRAGDNRQPSRVALANEFTLPESRLRRELIQVVERRLAQLGVPRIQEYKNCLEHMTVLEHFKLIEALKGADPFNAATRTAMAITGASLRRQQEED